jgi:uncharacterized protein YkwD
MDAAQLNWIAWLILLLVLLHAAMGIGRGVVRGALDLLGMATPLVVAVLGYRVLSDVITQVLDLPRILTATASFLLLALVAQLVYAAAVGVILYATRPVASALGPLAPLNRLLGAVPGAAQGLIFAALALLPFALFTIIPEVSAAIERSALGNRVVNAVVAAAPAIEQRLGRDPSEGRAVLPPPQTDEGRRVARGPVGALAPDPAAEAEMLELVNRERERYGLRPLAADPELRTIARSHSRAMFELGYLSHTSPVTGSPQDRLQRAGVVFAIAGENLAYAPNVRLAHEGLMNSPGHRANILRPAFGRVGIGVIKSELRGCMVTQLFRD